jgi:hypothetical protein
LMTIMAGAPAPRMLAVVAPTSHHQQRSSAGFNICCKE